MKVLALVLALTAVAAATAPPSVFYKEFGLEQFQKYAGDIEKYGEGRFVIDLVIRSIIEAIRAVIANGIDGILPRLDPLILEELSLKVPAGLINFDFNATNAVITGIGGFVANKVNLETKDLSLDVDITVPHITAAAASYDLLGDLLTAIPIYGNGNAKFDIENFRFGAKIFLKQSDNKKSVIIDRIENMNFEIPHFKTFITGAIGGGEIDQIVSVFVDEVILGYINRFRKAIVNVLNPAIIGIANPILEQLDTWGWIEIILPKP